jgi:hypothetical protein
LNSDSGSWTVSSAALRLMKSSLYGYNRSSDLPIISCCGYLLNLGCPNIISWDADIDGAIIEISNIEVRELKYGGNIIPDSKYRIDLVNYRKQVLAFARKVKKFYSNNRPRIIEDKYDQDEYLEYWRQFDLLFNTLKNGK